MKCLYIKICTLKQDVTLLLKVHESFKKLIKEGTKKTSINSQSRNLCVHIL